MKEFFVMNLSTAAVIFIATLIFARVCFKRRDLVSWLLAYISASLSEVFRLLSQEQYDTLEIIGITFSALSVLTFIIAVSYEYYKTFLKNRSHSVKTEVIPMIFLIFYHHSASIGLQIIIAVLLFIAFFLSFRIYLKKRTPTHAFMFFILCTGLLQLIASLIRDQGFDGADEFFEFSRIVMATIMLITGIVVIIEEKILRSERKYRLAYNRAEFYKDLFIHDINNILQNLQFSLEIISKRCKDYEKEAEMFELLKIAKAQVNRGAELGLNVKKLSDLEIGVIKNKPIKLLDILNQAIDKIKIKFPEEEIKIDIAGDPEKIYVDANLLLEDVFRIILSNAVKYNDNPIKEIKVKISKQVKDIASNIKIEFIDNGIGIADSMKKTIFQPVYTKTKASNRIGLGLLLVNEVIGNLSGRVWVEDKVQGEHTKGSKVILLVPETHGILDIER
ncbi:MAG: HAMP domain-containing histidine kinase [Promethearchaeota archaeon]|nr:MAG: HAMP domain-containing histidine kinase [Candidatus Lokiarchaeota archaeon]